MAPEREGRKSHFCNALCQQESTFCSAANRTATQFFTTRWRLPFRTRNVLGPTRSIYKIDVWYTQPVFAAALHFGVASRGTSLSARAKKGLESAAPAMIAAAQKG